MLSNFGVAFFIIEIIAGDVVVEGGEVIKLTKEFYNGLEAIIAITLNPKIQSADSFKLVKRLLTEVVQTNIHLLLPISPSLLIKWLHHRCFPPFLPVLAKEFQKQCCLDSAQIQFSKTKWSLEHIHDLLLAFFTFFNFFFIISLVKCLIFIEL